MLQIKRAASSVKFARPDYAAMEPVHDILKAPPFQQLIRIPQYSNISFYWYKAEKIN